MKNYNIFLNIGIDTIINNIKYINQSIFKINILKPSQNVIRNNVKKNTDNFNRLKSYHFIFFNRV